MKLLVFLVILVGCGANQYQLPKDTGAASSKPDAVPTGPSKPPAASTAVTHPSSAINSEVNPVDALPALSFTANTRIPGIKAINSGVKIDSSIFFTGLDLTDNPVIGRVAIGGVDAVLFPLGKISDNNIFLKPNLFLIGSTQNSLYLSDYHQIIEVDIFNMKAISKVDSYCSMNVPWTFLKDNRWSLIWNSTISTCGITDGATIQKDKPILDSATGNRLGYDSSSMFAFSGKYIQEYSRGSKTLTEYINDDQGFSKINIYSLGGYLYNSPTSVILSGDERSYWFLGCNRGEDCFLSRAEVGQQ